MSDEESDDVIINRTDGFWYRYAFRVLSKFVNKLKIDILFSKRDLPFDIQTHMLSMAEKEQDTYIPMEEQFRLLREYNSFINLELREQLDKLGIPYDETDVYKNVIHYAKAKGINLSDDKIILNQVLPWLGTNDWHSNSGMQKTQLENFKKKLSKLSRGGKINKKRSRKLQRHRKISKKN